MQKDVIENASENVSAVLSLESDFDRFRDSATERTARIRHLFENTATYLSRIRRRRYNFRAVRSYYFLSVRFLLGRNLDHIHLKVYTAKRARHRERRAPLSRSRLGRERSYALLFSVIYLRHCRIELMRTGCIVSFEFVIYLRGSTQSFLEEIRSAKGRRTVHMIEILYTLGYRNEFVGRIEFLLYYLVAKNGSEIVFGAWLHRLWINERLVLFLHASLDIEPCLRHLAFADIYFVRYFLFHNDHLLYYS